jgi:16S rRNA (cytosine967-C5)-methyltransferase
MTVKLFPPLLVGINAILLDVFNDKRPVDKVIEFHFKKNKKWGSRDRKFIAESVYDITRFFRKHLTLSGIKFSDHYTDENIRSIMASFFYEKKYSIDLPYFSLSHKDDIIKNHKQSFPVQITESVPDWLYEYGKSQMSDIDNFLKASNKIAPIYLRVNTLKTNRQKVIDFLKNKNIQFTVPANSEIAICLPERDNIFKSEEFQKGWFEVQDLGSQKIAELLEVTPGMRVIDACAGAGGKSLHLAQLLKNKGKIIAMDIFEKKLLELKKRAARAGVDIIETKHIDSSKVIKRLENSCDRLLLDVPCSGIGVLKRNPDTKWRIHKEEIDRLNNIQSEILENYHKMLKPGGKMIYATCSAFRSENETQVENFLKNHPEYKLETEMNLRPDTHPTDGFYAALMTKLK